MGQFDRSSAGPSRETLHSEDFWVLRRRGDAPKTWRIPAGVKAGAGSCFPCTPAVHAEPTGPVPRDTKATGTFSRTRGRKPGQGKPASAPEANAGILHRSRRRLIRQVSDQACPTRVKEPQADPHHLHCSLSQKSQLERFWESKRETFNARADIKA